MWLFTNIGFFSVVQKPNTSNLTIRARVASDLDNLRAEFMPALSATTTKGGHDYPFRATISHADFAAGLVKLGQAIHYPNFKDEVAKRMGPGRAQAYSKVWHDLLQLQTEPAPSKANARTHPEQTVQELLTWRQAVIEVLRTIQKPLSAEEIVAIIKERNLRPTNGRTPHATVAALIYSSIKHDGDKSPFQQTGKEFALRQPAKPPVPSRDDDVPAEGQSPSVPKKATGPLRPTAPRDAQLDGADKGSTSTFDPVSPPNHLADPATMAKLLRGYAHTCLVRRYSAVDSHEASKLDLSDASAIADTLLGNDASYTPVLPWNSPGYIDRWLGEHLRVTGKTPQEVVRNALVTFLTEIYRITNEFGDQPSPGPWEKAVDATVANFIKVFLGIWPFATTQKASPQIQPGAPVQVSPPDEGTPEWQPGDEFQTVGAIRRGDTVCFEPVGHKQFLLKALTEAEAAKYHGKMYRIDQGSDPGSFDFLELSRGTDSHPTPAPLEAVSSQTIELASEQLPCSCWGTINCQRTESGAWRIWFVMSDLNRAEQPDTVWETSGIKDAPHFKSEFLRCGVDFGSNPDLADLQEMLPAIAKQDPTLAAALRELLK